MWLIVLNEFVFVTNRKDLEYLAWKYIQLVGLILVLRVPAKLRWLACSPMC